LVRTEGMALVGGRGADRAGAYHILRRVHAFSSAVRYAPLRVRAAEISLCICKHRCAISFIIEVYIYTLQYASSATEVEGRETTSRGEDGTHARSPLSEHISTNTILSSHLLTSYTSIVSRIILQDFISLPPFIDPF